ncbi:50S ribosomal protein L23 [Candidatus Micrarchaeota archaeon CG08_land_8_20_14_0_20_59_11]|nr:MAG: 50S ribosomal protein L23 [Candidatus Micrarchaeota archaeon CG08_land_8_20_14_0_20_59_11]
MFVLYPLTSEKSVIGIEKENKMVFAVTMNATKPDIRKEIERDYGERVTKITVCITTEGNKKAFVLFERPGAAADLAAKLKVI